ncbi:MAG: L,D-transpeptidase family protein [Bacteroidota bacterium]
MKSTFRSQQSSDSWKVLIICLLLWNCKSSQPSQTAQGSAPSSTSELQSGPAIASDEPMTVLDSTHTAEVAPVSYVDSASIHDEIVELIAHIREIEPGFDQRTTDFLSHIYEQSGYEPIWQVPQYDGALAQLEESIYEGLNPADYYVHKIDSLLSAYDESDPGVNHTLVETDVLVTYAYLKFGEHLMEGRLNPNEIFPEWNYTRREYSVDVAEALTQAIKFDDPSAYLKYCQPQAPAYDRLKGWLRRLIDDDLLDVSLQLPEGVGALREGDSAEFILDLKVYLSQFSSRGDFELDGIFDTTLVETIKRFQAHHGLAADGILGKNTVAKLNMTKEERINVLRINLERCRWLLHDLPERFILVNVAGYNLYIFENMEPVYSSRVIVGQPHHETPVFHADIEYVEFNCTWTVPVSIALNETLPSILSKENYLETRHFEVLRNGRVVDPSAIDFSRYGPGNLPYTFRQKPGPWNALGRMKFIFPNEYSVYLHDTPARYLFSKEGTRAFSHGCVRVQNPAILAEQVLGGQGYSVPKIEKVLESAETQRVYLNKPLPILLTYWTAYTTDEGAEIYFVSDIYERDKRIAELMSL